MADLLCDLHACSVALAYLSGMFGLKFVTTVVDGNTQHIPLDGHADGDYEGEVGIVEMTKDEMDKVIMLIADPHFHPCMKCATRVLHLVMAAKLTHWQAGHHLLEDRMKVMSGEF